MNKKRQGGFTLVELIVVIAILGILAGVGTVAYTGYVEKANKAVDEQLVADIEYAMQLAYASDPTFDGTGAVLLSKDNATTNPSTGDVAEWLDFALKAAFGDNWTEALKLKCDWSSADNKILRLVANDATTAKTVANSSYLTSYKPSELVASFSKMTDALSNMSLGAQTNPFEKVKAVIKEEQVNSINQKLTDAGLSWSTEENADNTAYSTMLANLLVQEIAKEVSEVDINASSSSVSTLSQNAMTYAMYYSWAASSEEGKTCLDTLNAAIQDENADAQSVLNAFASAAAKYGTNLSHYTGTNTQQARNDVAAFSAIMGALNTMSDDYDMSEAGIFSEDALGSQMDAYASLTKFVADADENQINAVKSNSGGIIVFISKDGTVSDSLAG